jgi:predicted Zn-dependent peptidase
MIRLDEIRLPRPFDRHGMGTEESLAAVTRDQLASHQQRLARPSGSIMAAAGAVDHEEIRTFLESRLEDWSGEGEFPKAEESTIGGEVRIERATSQTHLAMGFDAPLASDPDSLPFRAATAILGGGASSRLFLEVRERRGLAYSVGARYEPGFALGTSTISAGTTPERIQETMDCIQGVLGDIEHGFTEEEVNRVRTQLRSGSLMQMEHGPARARQLAVDQFRLGRPRSLEDMLGEFENLDTDVVNEVSQRRMNEDWRARATRSIVGPAI